MDDLATSSIQPRSSTTARRAPSDGLRARLRGVLEVDFTKPAGEPTLAAPASVCWQIFKNPVALYIDTRGRGLSRQRRQAARLGPQWDLKGREKRLIRATARLMDEIPVPGSPPYQAARRLGLPGTYVWKRARRSEGASHRRTGRIS